MRPSPELRASGGAVIGSIATAVPGPSTRALMQAAMRGNLVIDGRNALSRVEFAAAGLLHESFGRPPRRFVPSADDAEAIRLISVGASVG